VAGWRRPQLPAVAPGGAPYDSRGEEKKKEAEEGGAEREGEQGEGAEGGRAAAGVESNTGAL